MFPVSLQECQRGAGGPAAGHEDLRGLHGVVVLDHHVSKNSTFPVFYHSCPAFLQLPRAGTSLLLSRLGGMVVTRGVPSSLSGLVIAMVASLIFIVLLRFLAGIMVWVMIVMVILVLGYGEQEAGSLSLAFPRSLFPVSSWIWTLCILPHWLCLYRENQTNFVLFPPGIFHCYMEYAKLKGEAGSDVSLVDLGFQTDLRVYLHLRQTWLAFRKSLGLGWHPGQGGTAAFGALLSAGGSQEEFLALWGIPWGGPDAAPSPGSDHLVRAGAGDRPAAHLPAQEDPHRHRAHQGGQQVRLSPSPSLWGLIGV